MKIELKLSKSISMIDSPVFCDVCQTTSWPSLIYFANFQKTQGTFPNFFFIVFDLLYMSSILLYQFVYLLRRFVKCVLYLYLLLNKINRAGFTSYLALSCIPCYISKIKRLSDWEMSGSRPKYLYCLLTLYFRTWTKGF